MEPGVGLDPCGFLPTWMFHRDLYSLEEQARRNFIFNKDKGHLLTGCPSGCKRPVQLYRLVTA